MRRETRFFMLVCLMQAAIQVLALSGGGASISVYRTLQSYKISLYAASSTSPSDETLSKEATTLASLERMKRNDKELMKTMGGKPAALKKSELVREVHKLLLSKFDEK